MIRIPSSWPAAQHPCAFVELREECYVCRLVPVVTAALSYKMETAVRVSLAEARRFASQDFAPAETHAALVTPCPGGVTYTPLPGPPGGSAAVPAGADVMVLRCPLFCYTARELTVDGPQGDVRSTAAHLTAALLGRYVVAGARFRTEEGDYAVRSLVLHTGYRGIALVGGDCRLRVNAAERRAAAAAAPPLVGVDAEVGQLRQLIDAADAAPGTVTAVMVRGPRGCGVSSVIQAALAASPARQRVFPWSARFPAEKAARDGRGGTCVLLVPDAEHVFAEAEPELAKMHLRKLRHDASVLRDSGNGQRVSVVVVCASHAYGLCAAQVLGELVSFHVVLSYPTAAQRARLIASVRGGEADAWQAAAQCLVGRSSAETLAAARLPEIGASLPFKAVPWGDIGGLAEVKERLHRALVWPQQQPELMARFHISPPRGILLYGPPGCAKTTLIRALCTEGNFSLIYLDSATVVSAFVGESERYLRDVFARARRQAPCLVFFDEVEVLGGRRVAGGHDSEHARLLSTLLTEMDGFADTRGVCFVGATNVPQLLDPALTRPGRFDYMVYVPLPDAADRAAILQLLLRRTAADVAALAACTAGFSGADLKVFCSEALLEVLKDAAGTPPVLADRERMTALLQERAAAFQRTHYDATALEQFHRDHTAS